jgi:hypothetical protein
LIVDRSTPFPREPLIPFDAVLTGISRVAIRGAGVQLESCAPMVSAVSSAVSAVLSQLPPPATGRIPYFFQVPDLSDETAAAISKANAWPTFIGICRAIHDRKRRGTDAERLAATNGMIGLGIKGLARSSGLDPVTVRRQVRRLAELGLVVVHRRGITDVADPATGRITSNRIGRTPASLVYLTVTERHMRPAAAKAAAKVGDAKRTPSAGLDRVQSALPSKDISKEPKETPTTPQDAGSTVGGHSAAKASQERRQATEATAGTLEPSSGQPDPVGNAKPPARSTRHQTPPPARSTRSGSVWPDGVEAAPPTPWGGTDAKRMAATRRRLDAERLERERQDATVRASWAAALAVAPPGGDQVADDLREALERLPADSRDRAAELGRAIEDDAATLNRLIEAKRVADATAKHVHGAATKEAARDAWHREKATGHVAIMP